MEFKELKKALAAEAKAAGICSEWYDKILTATTKERLIALYFGGFDFVEENDFPSEPLRREFDDIRRHYNVYEAEAFSTKNPRRLVAYTGAHGTAEYSNFAAAQLWARPGAEVHVKASGNAVVTVYVATGAKVDITAIENARVIAFLHGGELTQNAEGNAVIKIKNK